jgi:hypothetical protein
MKNHSSSLPATTMPSSSGAPPGDNSAAGAGSSAGSPPADPNGAALGNLLAAMQDQAAQLLTIEKQISSTNSGNQTAGSSGGNQQGLTADQQALLSQNVDFYKKQGWTQDQINNMINASTGPGAPRGVIAQSGGIDYLQNGYILPTVPLGTGGAIGGPRPPGLSFLKKKRKKSVADVFDILGKTISGAVVESFNTSHTPTSGVNSGAGSINNPPGDVTIINGVPVVGPGRPPVSQGGPPSIPSFPTGPITAPPGATGVAA